MNGDIKPDTVNFLFNLIFFQDEKNYSFRGYGRSGSWLRELQ